MQPFNPTYVMGNITFHSNELDQTDQFLQNMVSKIMEFVVPNQKQYLRIEEENLDTMSFNTPYAFEDFVEDQVSAIYTRPLLMNELIDQSRQLKKIHPKSQFNGLRMTIEYNEMNEDREFIHTGKVQLELVYVSEDDSIQTRVLQHNQTQLPYSAKAIHDTFGMDAIDTFTTQGIDKLIWHMNDFVNSWKNDSTEFPTLNAVATHLNTLDDPSTFLLSVFNQARTQQNTIVSTDPHGYIMNQLEEQLEASAIIQQLLASTIH